MLLSVVAGQGGVKVPGAPGTLSLAAGSPAKTAINLSWSAPSDTGGGTISGYRIKKDGSVLVADTSSTGTTYTATGLTVNTEYNFNVAAINEKGTGPDGNTPALTPANNLIATGGTITTYTDYKVHTFTGSGTFEITANAPSDTFDVLVVGGGGAGCRTLSGGGWMCGGAGGAGAFRANASQTGTVQTYTVTIGAGGTAALPCDGVDTVFGSITSQGGESGSPNHQGGSNAESSGGGSGSAVDYGSATGGSGGTYGNDGGGAVWATSGSGQGGSGGGGGAGSAGGDGTTSGSPPSRHDVGGNGGAGATNVYRTGSAVYYAGGGGGGSGANDTDSGTGTPGTGTNGGGNGGSKNGNTKVAATAGSVNTGSGGGGNVADSTLEAHGDGGSGIVVVRYPFS